MSVKTGAVVSHYVIVIKEKNDLIILLVIVAETHKQQPNRRPFGYGVSVDVGIAVRHLHYLRRSPEERAYLCRCCLPFDEFFKFAGIQRLVVLIFAKTKATAYKD